MYVADSLSRSTIDNVDKSFLEAGAANVHISLSGSDEMTKQHQEATKSDEEILHLKSCLKNG